ncbi:hypothetical protein HUT18_16225 [Streptomyces sp. NA04227]|uniref:DUF6879 family protein n=1 Tax=Streptomyces sp. NA04227 TaxID=2742136 RepID=UPI001592875F|nr:DUF6879 family protein [Streptomyces sp. NA04227]QKW07698.1 hypothetical protein HUT18_16225 [Streptomyces sp. NA04227]
MFDSFPGAHSERLLRPEYHQDFWAFFESGIHSLNKLERGQHFKERGFASWEAFSVGDWPTALSLVEERREAYEEQSRKAKQLDIPHRRLRVVEFPVTPYVQWEMHVLRVRLEVGEDIRIMDAREISHLERTHKVPEVVLLGDRVMYEVVYDEDGNADGARKFTDPALIRETSDGFAALYEQAEEFGQFFAREIEPLPAPEVDTRAATASHAPR